MVEYGNGVSTVTGAAGGGGNPNVGHGTMDVGAQAAGFVHDATNWVSSLPPEGLLLLVAAIFFALILVRKAI